MSARVDNLPREILQKVLSFTREVDGHVEIADEDGFYQFIADNVQEHPALAQFVKLNEEALTKHCQETGEVPPGVTLIKTTQADGENVTEVRIYHGPTVIPADERE
jgi:hypothetical protein